MQIPFSRLERDAKREWDQMEEPQRVIAAARCGFDLSSFVTYLLKAYKHPDTRPEWQEYYSTALCVFKQWTDTEVQPQWLRREILRKENLAKAAES